MSISDGSSDGQEMGYLMVKVVVEICLASVLIHFLSYVKYEIMMIIVMDATV